MCLPILLIQFKSKLLYMDNDDQKKKKMMRNDLTKEETIKYFKKDKPEKKVLPKNIFIKKSKTI